MTFDNRPSSWYVRLSKVNCRKSIQVTLYEYLGQTRIDTLVHHFYQKIETDEVIRPMYPKDLEPAEERMRLFLTQVFGGPTTYSDQRGHPRLRRRHFPYPIDLAARQRWMQHMLDAMQQLDVEEHIHTQMVAYFERASLHMINR